MTKFRALGDGVPFERERQSGVPPKNVIFPLLAFTM